MNKTNLVKVVLVASLTVLGFGLPDPAAAYLNDCTWGYCDGNWNCNCRCLETGLPTTCAQARATGCIDEF